MTNAMKKIKQNSKCHREWLWLGDVLGVLIREGLDVSELKPNDGKEATLQCLGEDHSKKKEELCQASKAGMSVAY